MKKKVHFFLVFMGGFVQMMRWYKKKLYQWIEKVKLNNSRYLNEGLDEIFSIKNSKYNKKMKKNSQKKKCIFFSVFTGGFVP